MQPFASTESRVDLQVKWAVKKGLSLPPPGTYKVDKAASEWPAASFNTRYREEWREDKTQVCSNSKSEHISPTFELLVIFSLLFSLIFSLIF